MKAIVLAGGKGTRLEPYTTILPKPLMPIDDMPILEVLLRQMKRAGIQEVVLTVGHLASLLRAYFGDGSQWGVKITYSHEQKPLGTAGPISQVQDLNKTFLVTNGDVLTTLDLRKLIAHHKKMGGIATIAAHQRNVKIDLGVIEWGGEGEIKGYVEKPTLDYSVSMGVYVFEPRVLEYIPHGEYLDFPDLILKMIKAREHVFGYAYNGYWMDLGRQDDYQQANIDFLKMKNQFLGEK
jgi:NDP-sugar pyrophosphorylase family protein